MRPKVKKKGLTSLFLLFSLLITFLSTLNPLFAASFFNSEESFLLETKAKGIEKLVVGKNNEPKENQNLENKEKIDEERIQWGGNLQLDHRVFTRSPQSYSFKEYRLEMRGEVKTEKTRFASTLWFRSLGFSTVKSSKELFVRDKILPVEVEIREAYVDLYGFLFPWLDLRIGRQRIAWGTADKINPTDNLNPDDLEDIWDFGRHLGSDAIKATGYFGPITLTGVFIPNFTPASPPLPDWAEAFMPSFELEGIEIAEIKDEIILPERTLRSSSIFGLKIGTNIKGYDLSLSFVHGRDDLPLLRDVLLENSSGQAMNVLARLVYPRLNILGFDLAGALSGLGLWAEGALFFPERVVGVTVFPVPGYGLITQPRIALKNKAYPKFVLGADYTFANGIYFNAQFAHGFLHERGCAELNDYFLFNLEWRLWRDKLKLVPLAGCFQIREWTHLKDNIAMVFGPSIEYHPATNAEITAGLRLIEGGEGTSFARLKDRDEFFLRIKYSF